MLEWAFRAFYRHARAFAAIVLVLRAPVTVLGLLVGIQAAATSGNLVGTTLWFDPSAPSSEIAGVAALLALLDGFVLTPAFLGAANRASVEAYLGRAPDGGTSIMFGLRRFPSILLINVLVLVLLIAVILPLVVISSTILAALENDPSILIPVGIAAIVALVLISVRVIFAQLVFVAEGQRGREALRRSWRLSKGHFWRVFGVLLLGAFLSGVATYAIMTITSSIDPGNGLAATLLAALGALLAQLVIAPFTTLLMTALFFSVRASKEPFDSGTSLSELLQRDPS